MLGNKTYIQCPYCECFVDRSTYNSMTCNYKCIFCGPFSKKAYKESENKLICKEIYYGEKGTDETFKK